MSNSQGIISKPVNLKADLGAVLGTGNGDLGYNIQNGNINPWAKYKAVRSSVIGMTGRQAGGDYWRGADKKCGFAFDVYSSFGSPNSAGNSFAKLLYNGSLDWVYARPRGGANYEYFRALDFDGYNHNAQCPLGDVASTTVYLQLVDGNYQLQIDFDFNAPVTYGLNLSEISADGGSSYLSSWYLGVLLYNGSTWWALTSTTTLGNDGYSMTCQFPASGAGSWQCVPFLSKNQISITSQGVANGSFLSFYNKHRFGLTVKLGSVTITPNAMWETTTSLSWELVIVNDDGTTKSFTNPFMQVQRTMSQASPAGGTAIGTKSLSNFSVQRESTLVLSSDALGMINTIEAFSNDYTYWVRFNCDQQGYVTPWMQIDQYTPPI